MDATITGSESLPEPFPSGRELLHKIWELQAPHGPSKWPTFGELDRAFELPGLDIADVLADLPEHLVYGLPDRSRSTPLANAELRLTVGGVALCGSSERARGAVSYFLEVVRILASGTFPASPDHSTGELYRVQTSDLLVRLRRGVGVPPFFETVLDFIQREPWCSVSGLGAGGWSAPGSIIGPGRKVRLFRDVHDIGEYWKIRTSLMPRRAVRGEPVDPIAVADVFLPQETSVPSLEGQAARLLMSVFTRTDGDISQWIRLHAYHLEQGITQRRLRGVLELSERHQSIVFERTGAGFTACLTPTGVQRAEALLRAAASRAVRFDYTTSALVTAAMEQYPNCVLDLGSFLHHPLSYFEGEVLSLDEILACARYLVEKGLITLEAANGRLESLARLTSLGIECGLTEPVHVRKFMTDKPGLHIGSINNYGGNNQIGIGNTMKIGSEPWATARRSRDGPCTAASR
ncbi:hypothetical protein [Streptomyces sp. NPDC051994]|uniref:hypothetical protein n=1 Tax=unclassified Streptomyces TaxID=2593676 RepID=UPI003429D39E